MAINEEQLTIKIVLDDKQANDGLKALTGTVSTAEDEFKKLQKSIENSIGRTLNTGQFKELGDQLNKIFKETKSDQLEKEIQKLGEEFVQSGGDIEDFEAQLRKASNTGEKSKTGFSNLQAAIVTLNQAWDLAGRAINLVNRGFSALDSVITEAGKIDALTRSFDTLQASVGQDSVQALNALRASTQGLVSDLDLISSANRAVQLGLPTEGFDKAAAAAIKLGRAMGVDATQAVNDFTTGVGRASPLILDNLGIIVKSEQAYKEFAEANKIVGRELTENEKKLAFQQAAYKAVLTSAEKTADITLNASDAYSQLKVTIDNATTSFLQSIANNETLTRTFSDLNDSLQEVDVKGLIAAFNGFVSVVAGTVIPVLTKLIDTVNVVIFGYQQLADAIASVTTGNTRAVKDFEEVTIGFNKGVTNLSKGLRDLKTTSDLTELRKDFFELSKLVNSNEEAALKYGDQLNKLRDKIFNIRLDTGEQVDVNEKLVIATNKSTKATKEQTEEQKEAEKQVNQLSDAIETSLIAALDQLSRGDFNLDNLISGFGSLFKVIGDQSGESIATGIIESFGGSLDGLANSLGVESAVISKIGGAVGSSFVEAFARESIAGIESVFSGKKLSGKQKLALAPQTFGLSLVFDDLKSAFGGKTNAAANAREAIEDIFNEAIKTANISAIFSDFGRDAFDPFIDAAGNATTLVSEEFRKLDSDSQAFFLGIGSALEGVFDIDGLESGQLGELLAANFGTGINSANDLQLILQSMGVTAEQVGQAIEEAWLIGDVSAGEFLNTLNQTEQLFTQGIPNAVGATGEAFDNLVSGGLNSGREALDAIGDLGAEFNEIIGQTGSIGEGSLDKLRENLIAQNKPIEDVNALFQAFADNGITSISDLENATARQAAGIINSLDSLGFGFSSASENIEQLARDVDKIKSKEIEIGVKIRTDVDNNTREYSNLITGDSGGLGGV